MKKLRQHRIRIKNYRREIALPKIGMRKPHKPSISFGKKMGKGY